jgi:hypothetical protein
MREGGFRGGALSGSRAPPPLGQPSRAAARRTNARGRRRGCGHLELAAPRAIWSLLLLVKVSREAWEHGAEVVGSGRRAEDRRRRGRASLLSSVCWPLSSAFGVLGAGCGRGIRAIRTARLHGLPRFDLRPIDVVVDHGSQRDLVWRRVSRLDAFSGYPDRT